MASRSRPTQTLCLDNGLVLGIGTLRETAAGALANPPYQQRSMDLRYASKQEKDRPVRAKTSLPFGFQ